MKKSCKRKLVNIVWIFVFLILASIFYYLFYSLISNGYTVSYCQNINCIEILSLAEFLSISTALLGIFWVVDSLNSWKDQDAYYNSRDINLELKKIIYACDNSIIIEIMRLPKSLPLDEMSSNLKRILPASGIGSPISNLCHKIEYENIYYRKEFKELSELVNKIIYSMRNTINLEKNNFENIDFRIHNATQNDLSRAKKLSDELQNKLYSVID